MQTPTADITGSSPIDTTRPGHVLSGIREAADSTGVSFGYLLAQATQESGLDPQARNTKSSASGLFQFTAGTWLDMVKRHGAEHGLGDAAEAITKGADGRLDVSDKAMKKAILDLRKDPKLSSLMAAEFAKDNAKTLEKRLGREATASDLYLAHFLGASGAARVIEGMEDNPKHSARHLLPDAARANPEVFGKARTVAGLYKSVQARFKSALGDDAASAHQPAVDTSNPQLAALRPMARPEAPLPSTPTETALTQVVQAVAPVTQASVRSVSASDFANALAPESPFFPAPIPSAPTGKAPQTVSLRDIVESIKAGGEV
ncbi:Flagellar protein FlgJ peptidoglycan hydrolase [Paramagnetospirillum magnetotacticum MS-1]|uniref:Flagellar protein FlgJ peptidoglycan hydrolase n=1 Tax=Paramagnetospirillum magnetotacticum MS-1 TaxID=272627 RepID=A0A0C2YZE5_PARME|nr:transglycosylase SLT domain-containing protein [Paramagnetospirillum magnetotacticum]KIM00021.1 Flagellar protein FlgJ peptidoglycan hydrolase [Paramagnetospirillum magnetotacticum MS-1]